MPRIPQGIDSTLYHQYGELFPGDNLTGYMASAFKTGQMARFEIALALCVRERRPMRDVYGSDAVTDAIGEWVKVKDSSRPDT